MKKYICLFVALFSGILTGYSQKKEKLSTEERTTLIVSKMDSVMTLSSIQFDQIRSIVLGRVTQVRGIREDASLSNESKKTAIQPIRKEAKAAIKVLLNKEQQRKWKAYRKEQRKLRAVNAGPN